MFSTGIVSRNCILPSQYYVLFREEQRHVTFLTLRNLKLLTIVFYFNKLKHNNKYMFLNF